MEPTQYSTSQITVQKLRATFARLVIPETVVTDNGTCFASKRNGVSHIKTVPYHPLSNGLAECAVRIFKEGLRKMK